MLHPYDAVMRQLFLLFVSAIPVFAATVTPLDRYVPLIRDGDGWTSTITLVNLGEARATFQLTYLNAAGLREEWKIGLKAPGAEITGQSLIATLQPGATLTVETLGTSSTLTEGYAQLSAFQNAKMGATARLRRSVGGKVVSSFAVPLSPEYEKQSVVAVDLTDGSNGQLVMVSGTSSATVDMAFRDETGKSMSTGSVQFGRDSQVFVNIAEMFPQAKSMRGTLEWKVSFPSADIYEDLTLAASVVVTTGKV